MVMLQCLTMISPFKQFYGHIQVDMAMINKAIQSREGKYSDRLLRMVRSCLKEDPNSRLNFD